MKYLAFDCSSENIYVCGFNGEERFSVNLINSSGTENLIVAIDECLKNLNLKMSEVDAIGVCVGPGSWTGCRVAVVTALGLVSGMGKVPYLAKITSFDMFNCESEDAIKVVKAYANFVFAEINGEPIIMAKAEFKQKFEGVKTVSAFKVFEDTEVVGVNLENAMERKVENADFVSMQELEPLYLRASQAEIMLMQKQGDKNDNKKGWYGRFAIHCRLIMPRNWEKGC